MASRSDKETPKDEAQAGFKDVTDAVAQAEQDAKDPIEADPETGEPRPKTSEAANEVAQEMAYRAGAQSNGGGPWPEDVLVKNFVGVNKTSRPAPVYTSHEDAE